MSDEVICEFDEESYRHGQADGFSECERRVAIELGSPGAKLFGEDGLLAKIAKQAKASQCAPEWLSQALNEGDGTYKP